jgi:hypothetical protein
MTTHASTPRFVTELLALVERYWATQSLAPGPGATAADVAAFEARYHVRLPNDLRAYFLALNGSEAGKNGPMDDFLIAFWHLGEVVPLSEEVPDLAAPDAEHWFVFADHCLWIHAYVIRLSDNPTAPTPVAVLYDEFLVEIAPSFGAFLEGYLARDQDLLFPEVPAAWAEKHGKPST